MKFLSIIFLSAFCASCSSVDVKEDYNPDYDFSKLRSYAWKQNAVGVTNTLIDERVRENVNRELGRKGYLLTLENEADFIVGYGYRPREEMKKGGVSTGIGLGFGTGGTFGGLGFGVGPRGANYVAEALLVDIYDKDGKTLLWRGVASETLMAKNPEDTNENFQEVVTGIVEKFPPEKK